MNIETTTDLEMLYKMKEAIIIQKKQWLLEGNIKKMVENDIDLLQVKWRIEER